MSLSTGEVPVMTWTMTWPHTMTAEAASAAWTVDEVSCRLRTSCSMTTNISTPAVSRAALAADRAGTCELSVLRAAAPTKPRSAHTATEGRRSWSVRHCDHSHHTEQR